MQSAPESTRRTLTVACNWGLSNRLRVLLSGMAMAEASGRYFTMLWPRTPECGALFGELFVNDLNVVADRIPAGMPVYGTWIGGLKWYDFLASPEPDVALVSSTWICQPELYPAHAALMQKCVELFGLLEPVPDVGARVQQFRSAHFRPSMIGVHLRRGDFLASANSHNLAQATAQVDTFLRQCPDAGIFLSTDDGATHQRTGQPTRREGVKQRFVRLYAERVVFTEPRSLDRRQPEAVQDALVDLLLLRETTCVVGTRGSSFSDMATFGRTVPSVVFGMSPAERRRRHVLEWVTGAYPLLKLLGLLEFRQNLPFGKLRQYYSDRLRRAPRQLSAMARRLRNCSALLLKARFPLLFDKLRTAYRRLKPR